MARYRATRYQEQPIYGIDYGKIVRDALAARAGIQKSEREEKQLEMLQQQGQRQQASQQRQQQWQQRQQKIREEELGFKRQQSVREAQKFAREGARTAEIKRLYMEAPTNAKSMAELKIISPQHAEQLENEQKALTQQKRLEDNEYYKGRAETAAIIKDKPINDQIRYVGNKLNNMRDTARYKPTYQNLYDMLASGDPVQIKEANSIIKDAYKLGQIQKYIPADKDDKSDFEMYVEGAGLEKGTEGYKEAQALWFSTGKNIKKAEDKIKFVENVKALQSQGLTKNQINKVMGLTEKGSNPALLKIVSDMEANRNFITDPQKKGDFELKTQKQYAGLTEGYRSMQASNGNIQSINPDVDSGPNDISLITGYMKMIDEGAVVREADFANLAKSGGLWEKLKTILPKAHTGAELTPKTRREIQRNAERMLTERKKIQSRTKKVYQNIVKEYGLSPKSIFFERDEQPVSEERKPKILTQEQIDRFSK